MSRWLSSAARWCQLVDSTPMNRSKSYFSFCTLCLFSMFVATVTCMIMYCRVEDLLID